jgi:hypothetical protein
VTDPGGWGLPVGPCSGRCRQVCNYTPEGPCQEYRSLTGAHREWLTGPVTLPITVRICTDNGQVVCPVRPGELEHSQDDTDPPDKELCRTSEAALP